MENIIILGAGGHAKVIADIAIKNNYNVVGFLDDDENLMGKQIIGYYVLGKIIDIQKYKKNTKFVIAIGSNEIRERVSRIENIRWATLVHPTAVIGLDVKIGDGTVVMANVVINASAVIGNHCIINTAAIIEHDDIIADYVHISPNVSLGGTVKIGEKTHIGIGANIKNNIMICEKCIIGAGACVVKDIEKTGIYVGIPARRVG